jgi:hypothetical protein
MVVAYICCVFVLVSIVGAPVQRVKWVFFGYYRISKRGSLLSTGRVSLAGLDSAFFLVRGGFRLLPHFSSPSVVPRADFLPSRWLQRLHFRLARAKTYIALTDMHCRVIYQAAGTAIRRGSAADLHTYARGFVPATMYRYEPARRKVTVYEPLRTTMQRCQLRGWEKTWTVSLEKTWTVSLRAAINARAEKHQRSDAKHR